MGWHVLSASRSFIRLSLLRLYHLRFQRTFTCKFYVNQFSENELYKVPNGTLVFRLPHLLRQRALLPSAFLSDARSEYLLWSDAPLLRCTIPSSNSLSPFLYCVACCLLTAIDPGLLSQNVFEILVFWVVALYSLVEIYWRFMGAYLPPS
jgi:hypothetical protein